MRGMLALKTNANQITKCTDSDAVRNRELTLTPLPWGEIPTKRFTVASSYAALPNSMV